MIQEIKSGTKIVFCRKSNSAFTCKMLNNKVYFVSQVNKRFLNENYSPILNGETFSILSIVVKDYNVEKIILYRTSNREDVIIRHNDIQHFCVA